MTIDARGCRDLERALSLEWLESNGRGGYASGTVAGANTRRYHALLLVARHPPVDRVTLVNHLEESIEVGGETYPLSTNLYAGAADHRPCRGNVERGDVDERAARHRVVGIEGIS